MFLNCRALTSLDLSSFNTSKVTIMAGMFANCTNLSKIYVKTNWDVSKVTSATNLFLNCNKLKGGNGTSHNNSHANDKTYARIDTSSTPGYFTRK